MWGFTFLFLLLGLILLVVGVVILSYDKRQSIMKYEKQSDSVERDYAWKATPIADIKIANNMCEKCKARSSAHHIKPKSTGETDSQSNLMPLCAECHKNEHGYEIEKRESGYETEPAPKDPKMELLLNAIENKKELGFDYINSKGKKTHRTVLPDEVYHGDNNRIYVKAYCLKHKEEWSFRISRMSNLKLKCRRG